MKNIAVFASGSGSNALKIIEHFEAGKIARVVLVLSNKKEAGVLQHAEKHGIPTCCFDRKTFYESREVQELLRSYMVDFIALAGFLWLMPSYLIEAFPRKIVNIHPALLPDFGGKGMYGIKVHEAVVEAKAKESGLTIHFIDERYDEGDIIFQARCAVEKADDAASLAAKVLKLEHQYYPKIIESLLLENSGF
jgi:phosphoribosylglycinamide formyltransferase 1